MNIKEADLSYLASPADPIGLEISGTETGLNPISYSSSESDASSDESRSFSSRPFELTQGKQARTISGRTLEIVGGFALVAYAAACGGGAEAKATTSAVDTTPTPVATGENILATQNPTVVVAPAPEVKVAVPVATATEAPKVEKTAIPVITVLDKPVTKVTIDQLRNEAITTYEAKPDSFKQSNGTIWPKANLEGNLKTCEEGDSASAGNAKFIAQDRLAVCSALAQKMVILYNNNGDPALMQIAVDARSYFVTQYPELKGKFDSFLK